MRKADAMAIAMECDVYDGIRPGEIVELIRSDRFLQADDFDFCSFRIGNDLIFIYFDDGCVAGKLLFRIRRPSWLAVMMECINAGFVQKPKP
jgi:hypothetical protein